jgi:hypothetical protein
MPKSIMTEQEILQAALIGFQHSLASVDEKIKELRQKLGVRGNGNGQVAVAAPAESNGSPKRQLSAAARRRIAAAQKKRWAAYRKSHQQ